MPKWPPFPPGWEEARAAARNTEVEEDFLVVGPHEVDGVAEGGVVRLSLTPGQRSALIEGGHVIPVPAVPEVPAVPAPVFVEPDPVPQLAAPADQEETEVDEL